jgi:hypothetical protein
VAGDEGQKGIDEGLGLGGGFVHLPVGGDECFAGHFVLFSSDSILSDACRVM